MNRELPTTINGVEAWLRSLAGRDLAQHDGEYPFLFGMATVKLAEAHAEIVRLRTAVARLEAEHADAR